VALVGRLTENEPLPSIIPTKPTAAGKRDAEMAETIFTNGFSQIQKQTGLVIHDALAQLLTTQALGVLHWQVDNSVYDGSPDYEEYDEAPEGDEGRYVEDEYPETVGRTKEKRLRESEDSLAERIAHYRASKGLPVFVEVLPVRQCYWRLGKYSNRAQFLEFMVKREIRLEDYAGEVNERAKLSEERDSPVEHQEGSKDTWQPSAEEWGETATLIQLWDKDCCYEICQWGDQKRVEKFPHHYGKPPFALALGTYWHGTDPIYMYEPALAGMYRHKAQYDRAMSLFHALAEMAAIRRYVLEDKGNQPPRLSEDGDNGIDMNANTATAGNVPGGKELKPIGGDANVNDFAQALALIAQELDEAAPGTGRAQFGASTQPWAARIEQAQENIEPKMYLQNIADCIQEMLQNLIEVFADKEHGPGEVFAWGSGQDGKLDRSKTVSLKAEGWSGLIAEVNIDPVSAAERITWEEHLRNLCNDSVIQLSLLEYLEQTGVPNPQQTYIERLTNNYIHANVIPGLLKQGAAAHLGMPGVNVLGADGQFIGPMGEMVSPAQQLAQQQSQQIDRMGTFRPQTGGMGTTPGPLPGATAIPGAAPMAGMVG
jgi:hypothetical protein